MKKIILFIFILASASQLLISSECDTNNIVYAVTNDEIGYLRYIYLNTGCKTLDVNYTFGEVRIEKNGKTQRIFIKPRKDEYSQIVYKMENGFGTKIMKIARTNDFQYAPGTIIRFYRNFHTTGELRKDRKFKFLVQIVDAADENKSLTIDSVELFYDPAKVEPEIYGNDVHGINHSLALPDEFAGKKVFIRIKPEYKGDAMAIMSLEIQPFWISKSAGECSGEVHSSLLDNFFIRILLYCDSVKRATGNLPFNLPQHEVLTEEQENVFLRFFFNKIDKDTTVILVEKPETLKGLRIAEIPVNNQQNRIIPREIIPQSNKGDFKLTINSDKNYDNVTLELFNHKNKLIGTVWNDKLNKGENSIELANLKLNKGLYYLKFITDTGLVSTFAFIKN